MVCKDCVRKIPSDYECYCRCHRTSQVHNECCLICPHCQRNVRHSKFNEHEKVCKKACHVTVKRKPVIKMALINEKTTKSDITWIVKLLKCSKCQRRILVEDALKGVSHTIITSVTCWDCLPKESQTKLKKNYNIKP